MSPFQGLEMSVNGALDVGSSTIDVFERVEHGSGGSLKYVPIKYNLEGCSSSACSPAVNPSRELRIGYNLVAPHIEDDSSFSSVYSAALIPKELAVAALSFEKQLKATVDSSGSINAVMSESSTTKDGSDLLNPSFSYWTYLTGDPAETGLNSLGQKQGPTILP
jgi:hypothetical protein